MSPPLNRAQLAKGFILRLIDNKRHLSGFARWPSARYEEFESRDASQKPLIPPYQTVQSFAIGSLQSRTLKSHGVVRYDLKVIKSGNLDDDTNLIKKRLCDLSVEDVQSPNIPHWAWSMTNRLAQKLLGILGVNIFFRYYQNYAVHYYFQKQKNEPLAVLINHRILRVPEPQAASFSVYPSLASRLPVLASNQKNPGSETFSQQVARYAELFEKKEILSEHLYHGDALQRLWKSRVGLADYSRDHPRSLVMNTAATQLSAAIEDGDFTEDVDHCSVKTRDFETVSGYDIYERHALPGTRGRRYQWSNKSKHRAFIAFGSNVGDRMGTIERAAKEMVVQGLIIKRFSSVYETAPMYKTDQPSFLNAVCEVETDFKPLQLLDQLQNIEQILGRVRTEENGPRTLDLDILTYDNHVILNERLIVPHRLMLEREFVLRPLCNLVPDIKLPQPYDARSLISYLNTLTLRQPERPRMNPLTCLSPRLPFQKILDPVRPTLVMAILNLTPDSFSDGGVLDPNDLSQIETAARSCLRAGARIIDIGGQSTRPGAALVSAAEEANRILPAIKHIRSLREMDQTAISVDTFYSSVAEAAVNAGADLINDVSGGKRDPLMYKIVAQLNTSMVLMHSRGDPSNMAKLTDYPRGVVSQVADELGEIVKLAEDAGVRPWHIILDPGIGFAKDQSQNLQLLRDFHKLRHDPRLERYSWLVGTSRKGFIGKITGANQASERAWGTAATVTASIQGGADIVRVHDVAEMSQVAKMADALFRVPKTAEDRAVAEASQHIDYLSGEGAEG